MKHSNSYYSYMQNQLRKQVVREHFEEGNAKDITFFSYFEKFSKLVNIVLGMSAILYILGYISWAMYAINYHLGILPILKEQYLTAGIIPSLIIFSFLLLIYYLKKNLGKNISTHFIFFSGGFSVIIIITSLYLSDNINVILIFLSIVIIGILTVVYYIIENHSHKFDAIFKSVINFFSIIFTCLTILFLYVIFIFPILPPELGGAKPIPIQIDLNKKSLSPATLSYILCPQQLNDPNENILTTQLYLIFTTDDYLILDKGEISDASPTIRLRKSIIQNVFRIPPGTLRINDCSDSIKQIEEPLN